MKNAAASFLNILLTLYFLFQVDEAVNLLAGHLLNRNMDSSVEEIVEHWISLEYPLDEKFQLLDLVYILDENSKVLSC